MSAHGLQTDAGTLLRMAPDWASPLQWLPVLSAYVAAVPPSADVCLCLDARDPELPADVVRELVVHACEYLADGRPFSDVLLVEDPGVDLGAVAVGVDGPEALAERVDAWPAALADDAEAVVRHARWAKGLADGLRDRIDRARFDAAPAPDLAGEPLVTVRIPTYGDPERLVTRALPSVLAGTYRNVEVLVCSDGPQPAARAAVAAVGDPRVRYLELPERPAYAAWPASFWRTAGTSAVNRLLDEARGAVIAPLDHDDAFTADHVARLLAPLRAGADFAYGQAMTELRSGAWTVTGNGRLAYGQVVHAAVAYTRRLAHLRYDADAWLLAEPGDWNLWRRIRATGAATAHVPRPVAVHFKEGTSLEDRETDSRSAVDALAADVLATDARRLLDVASPVSGAAYGRGARPERPAPVRLALTASAFPPPAGAGTVALVRAVLDRRPDAVVVAGAPGPEPFTRPVHPRGVLDAARELGLDAVPVIDGAFFDVRDRPDGPPLRVVAHLGQEDEPAVLAALGVVAGVGPGLHVHVVALGRRAVEGPAGGRLHSHLGIEPAERRALYRTAHAVLDWSAPLPSVPSAEAVAGGCVLVGAGEGALDAGTERLDVPPGDAEALLRALSRLASDPAGRRRIAARGAAAIRRVMDAPVVAEGLLERAGRP